MAWQDRLQQAAYTPLSGGRLTFNFEDVTRILDKKGTAFEFPDVDGTFVQTTGNSGRRFPLRVFFWGDDYDLEADAFDAALLESGIGRLEHPKYGTVNVVPFGPIAQRDDLKTQANQAVIEFTFWESINFIFPSVQDDPASGVLTAVEEYNAASAQAFEDTLDIDSAVEQATAKSAYQRLLDATKSGLQTVADTQADIQKQFDDVYDSINEGIDVFIAQPLTLAFQTAIFLQAPARALTNIKARLNGYKNLANSIIGGENAVVTPSITGDSRPANDFHINDLYAFTYVTGSVISVVNNTFSNKTEALEAAIEILDQFDDVINWRDDNFEALASGVTQTQTIASLDTGDAYQKLQEAVALTAGFLVQISFTLKQERRLILDRDRTFIDLVAELYGATDSEYDFFITSNNLSGSEIKELPRGREIVYYI